MVYKPIAENTCNHIDQDKGIKVTDMMFDCTNGNHIFAIIG